MKGEFPLAKQVLVDQVFPAFQVDLPAALQESYTLDGFLRLIGEHPELQAVSVRKRRFGYMVHGNDLRGGPKSTSTAPA